jgi:hypothetical protein
MIGSAPKQPGVVDVIINGSVELEDGKPTGILSGRALTKTPPAGTCL